MEERKINSYDLFKILDSNSDGFITIDEFCSGLDQIIELSQSTKEGLFAFFDYQKIGMIDFSRFLQVV